MGRLAAFHAAFAHALGGGDGNALTRFLARDGDAGVRVYRNNVVSAVAGALASNYPAVRRLVGDPFFNALAAAYFSAAPPLTRTLVGYGEDLPRVLEDLLPAEAAPYLGDVARLDRAWLEAHLAADAAAMTAGTLAGADAHAIARLRVTLHPSVGIVCTSWSVFDVWRANRDGANVEPCVVTRTAQTVLLWRTAGEVDARLLSAPEAAFLQTLEHGGFLETAAAAACDVLAGADISAIFAGALTAGVLVELDGESTT